ncbi:hypothetical protein ACFE04_019242 [Oxalis oulophora]
MNSILMDKYGCTAPQKRLYRARKHIVDIIEGEHKHMYALLPKYGMAVLQHNPGSRFKIAKRHRKAARHMLSYSIPSWARHAYHTSAATQKKRISCEKWTGRVTPWTKKRLDKNVHATRHYRLKPASDKEFLVIEWGKKFVPETIDECLRAPPPKRQPGRPPEKRKRAADEPAASLRSSTVTCKRCGKSGHNSRGCSGPIVEKKKKKKKKKRQASISRSLYSSFEVGSASGSRQAGGRSNTISGRGRGRGRGNTENDKGSGRGISIENGRGRGMISRGRGRGRGRISNARGKSNQQSCTTNNE